MIPRIKAFFGTLVRLLLATFLLNGCQPSTLYVGVESEPTTTASRTPQAKPSAAALKIHKLSSVVLTSSSDSSPDTAAPDRDTSAQSIANIPQDNALASTSVDITMIKAGSNPVARKRPATVQIDNHKEKKLATAKKEEPSTAHKAWFTAFADTAKKLAEDTGNEEVWDVMEDLLHEGAERKFMTASITYPNDCKPVTDYEYTPLHYVASIGLRRLALELVKYEHVPVDIQTDNHKNTPLHLASSRGHLDVVQFLIEQGANPNLTDNEECSALHHAAAGRNGEMSRDIIWYLIDRGADFKKTMNTGTTVLSMAIMVSNEPVIEFWEDNYKNNPDSDIDTLTEKALKLARYRLKCVPKGRSIQVRIIKILKRFLKARKDKNRKANAAK